MMIDINIWWIAYLASLVGGVSTEEAARQADEAVRDYREAESVYKDGEYYENG